MIPSDLAQVVLTYLEALACPRAVSVAVMWRYGEWDQLVSLTVVPSDYLDAGSYRAAAFATELLRKCESLPTSFDRKAAALRNFYAAEADCYRSNERLAPLLHETPQGLRCSAPGRITLFARKMIRSWLRRYDDELVAHLGRHGPGATYGDRGRLTTIPDKMSSRPTLTEAASQRWLIYWGGTAWAKACVSPSQGPLEGHPPVLVEGNRFTTVPKDATKHRGIAIEPSINVFYQLGLGSLLRDRLRRFAGLDLQRAQPIHRQVACEASATGQFATIDLSNASDTVSKNLVKLLLPHKWYEALTSLRSPFTEVDGRRHYLEKFSSMGNGFTFELETLLFLAIAASGCAMTGIIPRPGKNIWVYGDDIIVPARASKNVLMLLSYYGFTPNGRKTFSDGSFRESCGGDFFDGEDVRPIYLKEFPSEPQHWLVLANQLRHSMNHFPAVRRAWFKTLDCLPTIWRECRGPASLGDIVIHDDEALWRKKVLQDTPYIRSMVPVYRKVGWHHFSSDVVLASALLGAGDGLEGITPRSSVSGYKPSWTPLLHCEWVPVPYLHR